MDNQVKTREWVKTAAIIFLAVLLVLTFFSNTILNASLKPVMGQAVQSGSIKARISGQGMVKADETYDVTVNQTRKVASVKIKVGSKVEVGDVLFVLEPQESEELKKAQDDLAALQLAYDKALIEAGNTSASSNREVQKAQQAYDDAVALYAQTAGMDADALALAIQTANDEKARLEGDKNYFTTQKTAVTNEKAEWDSAYAAAQKATQVAQANLSDAEKTLSDNGYPTPTEPAGTLKEKADNAKKAMSDFESAHSSDVTAYKIGGAFLARESGGDAAAMKTLSERQDSSLNYLVESDTAHSASIKDAAVKNGYVDGTTGAPAPALYLKDAYIKLTDSTTNYSAEEYTMNKCTAQLDYVNAASAVSSCESNESHYKNASDSCQSQIDDIASKIALCDNEITKKANEITNLESASKAADEVKQKKQTLEDKIFEASKGNTSSLDLKNQKEQIEKKQAEVDDLIANSDSVEITSNVAGVVATVNTSAGKVTDKGSALATINLVDRGYTIQIPVTADQARRVSIGDTAETNSWSNSVTATLETIVSNPESRDGGKLLVFRLSGDVTPDQNLTITIGQKSQNFDVVIPKAAFRSDTQGNFVYLLTVKKTPLNNRYIAKRADVTVLAEDDNSYAVSGLNMGDFVIVNVTGQITDGEEVRLMESAG